MRVQLLDHLEAFVRAVDNVSAEVEEKVRDTIATYIGDRLNYEVLIQETYTRGATSSMELNPRWGSYGKQNLGNIVLPPPGGPYNGHAEYCFCEDKDIWIYAKGGGLLRDAASYDDVYGNKDLPRYRAYPREESRVSIVRPIRNEDDGRPLGVLTIESRDSLKYSRGAETILAQLGRIISVAVRSARESRLNAANTLRAARELHGWAENSGTFAKLCQKPLIFQAHSSRAPTDLLDIVSEAVTSLSAISAAGQGLGFEHRTWKDSSYPKDIMADFFDTLRKSIAGIAYLSEPAESAPGRFSDNPNVLYEAGIMHGLGEPFRGYLLIREANSISDFPFDIAQKRSVIVQRDRDNAIHDRKQVESQVRKALSELLEEYI